MFIHFNILFFSFDICFHEKEFTESWYKKNQVQSKKIG